MEIIKHNNIEIVIFDNGHFALKPFQCENNNFLKEISHPNFELNIDGGGIINLSKNAIAYNGFEKTQKGILLKYKYREELAIEVELTFVPCSDVVVQQNTVLNVSDKTIKLTRFSSAYFSGIAGISNVPYYENEEIGIWLCHNKWQGEGQWQTFLPEQLGIYPGSTHPWECASYAIQAFGSRSTESFYPMTVVTDGKSGYSWFAETEGAHSWMLKYSGIGGYAAQSLCLEATSADEYLGWTLDLKPNQSYKSERAVLGLTEGGFESAVHQLLNFKRYDSAASYHNGVTPVVFNVYMDCIWGDPSPARLLPLIDKAAEAGAEIFVIDGGWSKNKNGVGLGDWLPNDKYAETSLSEIIEKIKEKGLVPGIWTELDTVSDTAEGYYLCEDAVLKRYGKPIGIGRTFYNFNCEKVCEYLKSRIKYLYDLGFRYIKNDYNHSAGLGSTNNSESSPLDGERRNSDAFVAFIDEIRKEYPDLIIENCGGGALRSDNKTLRHFEVQSTSDQELYQNNVSILMGSMTQMPPEKCGMWAYPYPAAFEVRDTFEATPDYVAQRQNGYETAFNMVTSMFGTMFLSGRIDCCDSYNLDLIKRAVRKYKEIRHIIPNSKPIFPCGMCNINHKGCFAFGLLSSEKLICAVWNIGGKEESIKVDFSDYISDGRIADAYFADNSVEYGFADNILSVKFNGKDIGAFFEIEF